MVDLTNPLGGFLPGQQGPEVIPNPSPEQQSDIAGQWKNWMANEGNRAALMQFGIAMMQPVGLGQSPAGHVGQAIGSVGELGTRREEAERKERELSSKEELRSAQAQVAEARAGAAGVGAGRAADRLAFQRERLASDEAHRLTGRQLQALTSYQALVRRLEQDNLVAPPNERKRIPTQEEYLQGAGLGHLAPTTATSVGGGGGVGGTAPPNTGRTPGARAVEALRAQDTPQRRQEFDAFYGPGAAARVLDE